MVTWFVVTLIAWGICHYGHTTKAIYIYIYKYIHFPIKLYAWAYSCVAANSLIFNEAYKYRRNFVYILFLGLRTPPKRYGLTVVWEQHPIGYEGVGLHIEFCVYLWGTTY